jgi:hypothetical protein
LKKRNKKLLFFGHAAETLARTGKRRSFLVLFFKKELFLGLRNSLRSVSLDAGWYNSLRPAL